VAASADKVRWATAAAETGMGCGKAVGAGIGGPRTASGTTIDHPDQTGRVCERTVGDRPVGNRGLGKTEWMDTRNG
jgi:hypothetical protein